MEKKFLSLFIFWGLIFNPFLFCLQKNVVLHTVSDQQDINRKRLCEFNKFLEHNNQQLLILTSEFPYRDGVIKPFCANLARHCNNFFETGFERDALSAGISFNYAHRLYNQTVSCTNCNVCFPSLFCNDEFFKKSLNEKWDYWDDRAWLQQRHIYYPLSHELYSIEDLSLNTIMLLYRHTISRLDRDVRRSIVCTIYTNVLQKMKEEIVTIYNKLLRIFAKKEFALPFAQLIYSAQFDSKKCELLEELKTIFNKGWCSKALALNVLYHIEASLYENVRVIARQKDTEQLKEWLKELGWQAQLEKSLVHDESIVFAAQ